MQTTRQCCYNVMWHCKIVTLSQSFSNAIDQSDITGGCVFAGLCIKLANSSKTTILFLIITYCCSHKDRVTAVKFENLNKIISIAVDGTVAHTNLKVGIL